MITLEIKNVPEDDAVILEIKTNTETTIKNYLERTIKVYPPAVVAEFETKVAEFKTANAITVKPIINEIIK